MCSISFSPFIFLGHGKKWWKSFVKIYCTILIVTLLFVGIPLFNFTYFAYKIDTFNSNVTQTSCLVTNTTVVSNEDGFETLISGFVFSRYKIKQTGHLMNSYILVHTDYYEDPVWDYLEQNYPHNIELPCFYQNDRYNDFSFQLDHSLGLWMLTVISSAVALINILAFPIYKFRNQILNKLMSCDPTARTKNEDNEQTNTPQNKIETITVLQLESEVT